MIRNLKKILKFFLQAVSLFFPGMKFKSFALSFLHSILLIFISLFWLTQININDGFEFMNNVYDVKDFFRLYVFKNKNSSDLSKKYLLVNTSHSNQLLSDNTGNWNDVIVNRKHLTNALNVLDNNSDKIDYIICDVFFEEPDYENDSSLNAVIQRLNQKNKIVLSYYLDEEGNKSTSIYKSKTGLSQYRSSFLNAQFLKFTYLYNGHRQIPLVALEQSTGKQMEKKTFLGIPYYTLDNKWCINTIIPPFKYLPNQLNERVVDLGLFAPEDIGSGQVVFIGDFEGKRDIHHTIADRIPGPLILVNAYDALINGIPIVRVSFLLVLLMFFMFISYNTFYKTLFYERYNLSKIKSVLVVFLVERLNYILIFIMTIVLMFAYNFYINLFVILGYFAIIDFVLLLIRKKRKNEKSLPH